MISEMSAVGHLTAAAAPNDAAASSFGSRQHSLDRCATEVAGNDVLAADDDHEAQFPPAPGQSAARSGKRTLPRRMMTSAGALLVPGY